MAKKVNITVPDELHEKMQKCRKDFNFSAIFQEAVAEAIERKESFRKRLEEDEDMAEIVERLKKEKAEFEGDFYSIGFEDGARWAKAASYEDLQIALDWSPVEGMPSDKNLAEYLKDEMSVDLRMGVFEIREKGRTSYSLNDLAIEFLQGWKAAVEGFWKQVKDKI